MGIRCEFVQGSDANFKITTVEDLYSARLKVESKMTPSLLPRVGSGYDVHRFSDDAERPLMLGGVRFEGARALDGHSDADALLHAITDAVLGAACLGDIGMHFSNEDPRWKNAPSRIFLEEATKMVREMGYQIGNIDATVIAEEPKVMRRSVEIREAISAAAGVCSSNVSVKATTNERMGFIGRSEGIAAFATVMLVPWQ
jgi:2-C-methyl-D-erythritol 2,4-cyclodiphosphate synthase